MSYYGKVPPGYILKIKLKKFKLTIDELANKTGLNKDWLDLITKDAMPIIPFIADKLEKVFDIKAKEWLLLEKEWLKHQSDKTK